MKTNRKNNEKEERRKQTDDTKKNKRAGGQRSGTPKWPHSALNGLGKARGGGYHKFKGWGSAWGWGGQLTTGGLRYGFLFSLLSGHATFPSDARP